VARRWLDRVQRLPFWVRAVGIGLVLVVPFVSFIAPGAGPALLTNLYNPGLGMVGSSSDLLYQALLFGVLVYMLLATRFIRQREVRAAERLTSLLDDPVAALAKAFRPAHWLAPPVVAAALYLGVYLVDDLDGIARLDIWTVGPFLVDTALAFGRFVIIYVFVWTYCASIVGLGLVCRLPLHLQPYYRDRLLGTRPLGQLSLSLAVAFLVGLALAALWVAMGNRSEALFAFPAAVGIVGVVLCFLPLHAVHVQMRIHKAQLADAWATRYEELFVVKAGDRTPDTHPATLDGLRDVVSYEVVQQRIAAVRTWPFDTQILVRLGTSFVLPIVLAVLTRQAVLLVLGI
jgi:hypothetical protein